VNSYRAHNHTFAQQLANTFDARLRRPDLLNQCVGLNRLWIQTGSLDWQYIFKADRSEGRAIVEKCEAGSRRLIELLRPRAVALIGVHAQEAIPNSFRTRLPECVFRDCRHPGRGGMSDFEVDLRELINTAAI